MYCRYSHFLIIKHKKHVSCQNVCLFYEIDDCIYGSNKTPSYQNVHIKQNKF
jgi:hypothetical protein